VLRSLPGIEGEALRAKWIVALLVALAGCQTPYQDMGYDGGVSAAPITNNVYRISARGNGFTDPTTVQDYSLLKAAEVTLQSGHTHFIVVDSSNATTRDFGQTPGTFQTNVIGNTAYTTYNPGVTYDIVKPGQDLLIQVGTPAPGQVPPLGAFPAQQVYDNISPRVQRAR